MATNLTTMRDVQRPENISKLPQWAEERSAFLRKEHQPDRNGVHREMVVLPKNLILDGQQRVEAERNIGALDAACQMTSLADMAYAKEATEAVFKMTMVLPSQEAGEMAREAKGEAYMAALEDVPFWAIKEAIRKWYRSEYGEKNDYRWQPGPAILREIAMLEVYRVKAARRTLADLLAAEPLVEFTAEHQDRMRIAAAAHLKVKRA